MSDKPKFFLAPSRLGRPAPGDESQATAKPNFTGLKESKLGVLAESKLAPNPSSVSTATAPNGLTSDAVKAPPPVTFNFAPLTKPAGEDSTKIKSADAENKNPNLEEAKKEEKFVFGQNLTERVENVESKADEDEKSDSNQTATEKPSDAVCASDSPSKEKADLLFSNSVSPSTKAEDEQSKVTNKTLSESAAEYTESHSNKRKYDVVDVVTGEEEESNVFQVNVKLYIFDSDKKNWVERGRGMLRLNDDPSSTAGHLRSRLVMRTVGSLKVVLNTKLFPNMICEKANEKNVRISAMEDNDLKVFLISGSPKDAEKIYTAVEYRINQLNNEKRDGTEEDEEGPPPEKKVAKTPENNDDKSN